MQKTIIIIVVAVAVALAASFALFQGKEGPSLSVKAVSEDPSKYPGTITVAGVVAGVAKEDPTVVGILDTEEAKCKTPGCSKVFMPVRYPGERPGMGDEVKVTGSFVKQNGSLFFQAKKLKVVKKYAKSQG